MVGNVTHYPGIGTAQWCPVEVFAEGDEIWTIVQGWGLVSVEKREHSQRKGGQK